MQPTVRSITYFNYTFDILQYLFHSKLLLSYYVARARKRKKRKRGTADAVPLFLDSVNLKTQGRRSQNLTNADCGGFPSIDPFDPFEPFESFDPLRN